MVLQHATTATSSSVLHLLLISERISKHQLQFFFFFFNNSDFFFSRLQQEIMRQSRNKHIVIFLDYDGTLSPIVDDPDLSFISNEMQRLRMKAMTKTLLECC